MCSKFTGAHPCRSVISIKLLCNFIDITLRNGCSPENLLHIFRTPFTRNASGWLLLEPVQIAKIKKDQGNLMQNDFNLTGSILKRIKEERGCAMNETLHLHKCEKHSWSNTPPWVFFTFLKLYKWYQIAQSITFDMSWL